MKINDSSNFFVKKQPWSCHIKQLLLGLTILVGSAGYAQVGIGTSTPDANAQLDIKSTDKGVLIPRMTEAQVTSLEGVLTSTQNGMLVYNETEECIQMFLDDQFNCLVGSSENLNVDSIGNVGIGTSITDYRLHVVADSSGAFENRFNLFDAYQGTTEHVIVAFRNISPPAIGNKALIGFSNGGDQVGGAAWAMGSIRTDSTTLLGAAEEFYIGNSTGGTYFERFRITDDGKIGIGTSVPTSLLSVNGTADKPGGGSWAVFSDARSKENVVNYELGLDQVLQLNPVSFNYKPEFDWGSDTYVGVLAQDVEQVAPSMVTEKNINGIPDFKEVDPNEFVYMLINAVQELNAQVESLQSQIDALENQ